MPYPTGPGARTRRRRRALPAEWEAVSVDGNIVSGNSWQVLPLFLGVNNKVQNLRGVQVLLNSTFGNNTINNGAVCNLIYGFVKVTRAENAFVPGNASPSSVQIEAALTERRLLLHKSGMIGLNIANQPIVEVQYGGITLAEGEGLWIALIKGAPSQLSITTITARCVRRERSAD